MSGHRDGGRSGGTALLPRRSREVLRYFLVGVAFDALVMGVFVANPTWAAYFYAGQFPILTRTIFGVFFLGMGITYVNFARLVREEHRLDHALRLSVDEHATPWSLAEALPSSGVRERLLGILARPERAHEGDPVSREALESRESIHAGWARYVTSVLTMLGLVGTFLGLMVAIEAMRTLLSLQDQDAFFSGVVGALQGMGTAFSTSLAGVFGAVVLGFEQLLLHQAQLSFLTRIDLFTERWVVPRAEVKEEVTGLAVELHRFREDLKSWRVDAATAGADLRAAAEALSSRTGALAETSAAVLSALRGRDEAWRKVEEEIEALRRLAEHENRSLLDLVSHRVEGLAAELESGPRGVTPALDPGAGSPDAPGTAGALPPAEGDPRTLAELRRMNDLLASIHREMTVVLRAGARSIEDRQAEVARIISRVVQRMDAQAAGSTEQVLLLRTLLGYFGQDERRLHQLMATIAADRKDPGSSGTEG